MGGIEKEWVGRELVTVNWRFFAENYTHFPLGCFERKLIKFECFESNVTAAETRQSATDLCVSCEIC